MNDEENIFRDPRYKEIRKKHFLAYCGQWCFIAGIWTLYVSIFAPTAPMFWYYTGGFALMLFHGILFENELVNLCKKLPKEHTLIL